MSFVRIALFAVLALVALLVPLPGAQAQVLPQPTLTVSPPSVGPGQRINVLGRGFTPGRPVRVIAETPTPVTVQASVQSNGAFVAVLTVPAGTPSGTYRVSAQVSTFTPITSTFRVEGHISVPAYLRLSPTALSPGQNLTVDGFGFTPNSVARVVVLFPRGIGREVRVNGSGAFSTSILIPEGVASGTYRVSAQVSTFTPITADFNVTSAVLNPRLHVTPAHVQGGQQLTVTGSGFLPNRAVRVVGAFPIPVARDSSTDRVGGFQVALLVPPGTPGGAYSVSAQIATYTPVQATVSVVAPKVPRIGVAPNPVDAGSLVRVVGADFTPGASVRVAGLFPAVQTQVAPVTTQGSFSASLLVPAGTPAGTYTVSAQVSTFTPITTTLTVANRPTGSWDMENHDAEGTNFDPTEHVIGPQSVNLLRRVWGYGGIRTMLATNTRVYALTNTPAPSFPAVVVLDAASGNLIRLYSRLALGMTSTPDDAPAAIAYSHGRLVIGSSGEIVAINPETGQQYWRVPGGAFSLVAAGTTIYTGKYCQNPCGTLASYAINVETGQVLWSHTGSGGRPTLARGDLYQVIGTTFQPTTKVYNAASGQLIATYQTGIYWAGNGHQAFAVTTRTGGNPVTCHSTAALVGPPGAPGWQSGLGNNCTTPPPVLAYDTVYAVGGPGLLAVNATTGHTRWAASIGPAMTIVGANHLIFALHGSTGNVDVVDASSGAVVRRFTVPGYVNQLDPPAMIVSGGTLYVADGAELIAMRP